MVCADLSDDYADLGDIYDDEYSEQYLYQPDPPASKNTIKNQRPAVAADVYLGNNEKSLATQGKRVNLLNCACYDVVDTNDDDLGEVDDEFYSDEDDVIPEMMQAKKKRGGYRT